MLKSPALLWGHSKHKMSFCDVILHNVLRGLTMEICLNYNDPPNSWWTTLQRREKWTHTYLARLRYVLLNWSATSKFSRTRKALLERVMAVPSVRSLSDCSNTTAFSPTLLQSTKIYIQVQVLSSFKPGPNCFEQGFYIQYYWCALHKTRKLPMLGRY